MALDFEELVQQLLYDVALAGKIGLGIEQLGSAVKAQYDAHTVKSGPPIADIDEDILFSAAPPETGIEKLDDDLVELAWQWLSNHNEVKVQSVTANQPTESGSADAEDAQAAAASSTGTWTVSPALLQKYGTLRLTTGETRIWQAIAGHGPDFKRLPLMEFELLSIIAAYGAKGIFQPQLVRLSGQDKRSVPMRTDRLTKKGYITKESVIALKVKTSLLKLTRFAVDASALEDLDKAHKTVVIRYDAWFVEFVRLMKENNNIIAYADLRIGLGINGKRYETKTLQRCIRRLAQVGCLRKVTAREAGNEYDPHAKVRHTRALQLLREPNDLDRQAFTKSVRGQGSRLTTGAVAPLPEKQDNGPDQDDDSDGDEEADLDDSAVMDQDDEMIQFYDTKPVWTPDLHLANLLFRCIEDAGVAGIGSTDLYRLSVGGMWKRAVDDTLIRLATAWHLSQPTHLRHLAIVRDSSQSSGAPTYHYRTYDNFQKAVDAGHVAWDHTGARARAGPIEALVGGAAVDSPLDSWGFPVVPSEMLVRGTGDATLSECQRSEHFAEPPPIAPKAVSRASDSPPRQKRKYTKRPSSFEVPQVFYRATAAAIGGPELWAPVKVTPAKRKRVESDAASTRMRRKVDHETQVEFAHWAHSTAVHLAQAEFANAPSTSVALSRTSHSASPLRTSTADEASSTENTIPHEALVAAARQQRETTAQALKDYDATAPKRKPGAPSKAARAEMEKRVIHRKTLLNNASAAIAALTALANNAGSNGSPVPAVTDVTKATDLPVTPRPESMAPAGSDRNGTTMSVAFSEGSAMHVVLAKDHISFDDRVAAIEAQLLSQSRPGLYINPPAATALKTSTLNMTGRWPKAKIAVVRSERLRDLPWFDSGEVEVASSKVVAGTPSVLQGTASPFDTGLGQDFEVLSTIEAPPDTMPCTSHAPDVVDRSESAGQTSNTASTRVQASVFAPQAVQIGSPGPTTPVSESPATRSAEKSAAGVDIFGASAAPAEQRTAEHSSARESAKSTPVRSVPPTGSKQGRQVDQLGPGNLHMKRRQIILDILGDCGGLFPGKNEIWFPFTTIWFTQYKQRPDKKTVEGVVKGLVQSGKIKRLLFTFRSNGGFNVERAIICMPDMDPLSQPVKDMQAKISEVYPATYLPKEVHVDSNLRATIGRNTQIAYMQKLAASGQGPGMLSSTNAARPDERPKAVLPPHYIRDNFVLDPKVTVKRAFAPPPTPETAASRKRQMLSTRGPRKLFGDVDSSDDDEQVVSAAQAALQGELRLSAYEHEFSALSERTLAMKYRRVIDISRARVGGPTFGKRGLPGNLLKKRLELVDAPYFPSVAAHTIATAVRNEPSHTGTPVHDFDAFRKHIQYTPQTETKATWHRHTLPAILPSTLQSSGISVNHTLLRSAVCAAPQSMRDILGRDLPINPKDREDETIRFLYEVARVETWELNVVQRGVLIVPGREAHPFINYTSPRMGHRSDAEAKAAKRLAREMQLARARQAKEAAMRAGRYGSQNEAIDVQSGTFMLRSKDAIDIKPKLKQRDRRAVFAFLEKDYDRLTKAVSLMMTVVGGLGGKLNWMIVQHAFRYRYTSEFLRHRWDRVRMERKALVTRLQEMLWEPFLEAYEAGDLPLVDFQYVENTDWPALLDWVENEVLVGSCKNLAGKDDPMNKLPDLPQTVGSLVKDFEVAKLDNHPGPALSEYYSTVTQKGRDAIANLFLFGEEVNGPLPQPAVADQKELIRTWARAIALTEDQHYDLNRAHTKVTQFGSEIVDQVCKEMCADEVLHLKKVGRRLPGRNFEIHQNFWRVFSKWSKTNEIEFMYLRNIAKRREEILQRLENDDSIVLSLDAPEDEIVVLTNMVAQGLLQVSTELPARNDDFDAPFPRISAFGYSGLNYNVRNYDRTRLRFPVIYEKTDAFTTEHGLNPNVPIPIRPSLRPGEAIARTPLWIDIHDNVLPRVWELVLRSLLFLVVYRPGISAQAVQDSHKGKLGAWEAKLALQWMEATGLAERVDAAREEDCGWRASEWWYCALASEIALWPAADVPTEKRDRMLTGEMAVDLTIEGDEDAEIAE